MKLPKTKRAHAPRALSVTNRTIKITGVIAIKIDGARPGTQISSRGVNAKWWTFMMIHDDECCVLLLLIEKVGRPKKTELTIRLCMTMDGSDFSKLQECYWTSSCGDDENIRLKIWPLYRYRIHLFYYRSSFVDSIVSFAFHLQLSFPSFAHDWTIVPSSPPLSHWLPFFKLVTVRKLIVLRTPLHHHLAFTFVLLIFLFVPVFGSLFITLSNPYKERKGSQLTV